MATLSDTELLRRLVAFDSAAPASSLPVADFLCEYLEGPEVRVERQFSPDGSEANLLIRFGPEPDGARDGLVFCGHLDVVPAREAEWKGDPFVLREEGGHLVGRGACDMKGFLAVAANVAREACDLRAPLVLLLTYGEERGTVGARHFVEHGPDPAGLPRSVVVGEPTGLRLVRMHKGHLKLRVRVRGESAHSGYPHLGRNAIEAMGRILAALRGVRHMLEEAGGPYADEFPDVPYVPLNLGVIHGGSAVNVVPDRCELELGIRLLPGMVKDGVVALLYDKIAAAAAADPFELETLAESPPLRLDESARIHRELCARTGQKRGAAVSYATDAGWLATVGLECAVFGPGSIERAHKPNESVPIEELLGARAVLKQLVRTFCAP